MLELTDLQQSASSLVGHSALLEVRLFESHARHLGFPDDDREIEPPELEINVQGTREGDGAGLVYLMEADLTVRQAGESDDDEPEEIASFTVAFGALYGVDEEARDVDDACVDAFGQCVASLALWPYIRAEVAHLSEAMRLPRPLTLPILTQRDLIELAR